MKSMIVNVIHKMLGNQLTYRLGRTLYMTARNESGHNMSTDGEFRTQNELIRIFSLENKKMVVFDVGANFGVWTMSLLNKIPPQKETNIEIHAFEPISETFQILKNNIENHPLAKQVILLNYACSSKSGSAKMFLASTNSGSNSLHKGEVHTGLLSNTIQKLTLDKYCEENNITKILYIKCDTEGHDADVIRGSARLFREEKIIAFQFEYNQTWLYSRNFMKDVFDLLDGMPYVIGKISSKKLQMYRKWHPEIERFFESNYIIIHQDALRCFNHDIGSFDESYYYVAEN